MEPWDRMDSEHSDYMDDLWIGIGQLSGDWVIWGLYYESFDGHWITHSIWFGWIRNCSLRWGRTITRLDTELLLIINLGIQKWLMLQLTNQVNSFTTAFHKCISKDNFVMFFTNRLKCFREKDEIVCPRSLNLSWLSCSETLQHWFSSVSVSLHSSVRVCQIVSVSLYLSSKKLPSIYIR